MHAAPGMSGHGSRPVSLVVPSGRSIRREDDPPILWRVARGEASAVQACMNRYGGLVWSLARRHCPTRAEAEDATQEIFLDLWKSAGRYDPAQGPEAVFVTVLTRRRLIDRMRSRKREVVGVSLASAEVDHLVDAGATGERASEARLVARALDKLRPEQRQVLLLAIGEGLSHEQIARVTGFPLGTVKTHARRGLIRVRELLRSPGPEDGDGDERGAAEEDRDDESAG